MDHHLPIVVPDDPGVECVEDPLSGLSEDVAREVLSLVEGKAIGTALMVGNVAARDAALRHATAATTITRHLRLAAKNTARALEPIVDEARKSVGMLLRMWMAGRMSYDDVQLQTAQRWREAYEATRDVGRGAAALDRVKVSDDVLYEEEGWFRGAVREELRYWHVFLEEIQAGKVQGKEAFRRGAASGRLHERFEAYLRALRFMYESSRIYALPPETLVYWMGPKPGDPKEEGRICEGCVYLMERSPFPKDRVPAVPHDGSTACLTNCRHRVVVRVARLLSDVSKRRAALPTREAMVRELREIKDRAHGTHRARRGKTIVRQIHPVAGNPFRGEPLPESVGEARGDDYALGQRVKMVSWSQGDAASAPRAHVGRSGVVVGREEYRGKDAGRPPEWYEVDFGGGGRHWVKVTWLVAEAAEAAHDPEVVFDLPVVSGEVPMQQRPDDDDEAAADPTTGRLMGKPAVINRPDYFRFAPDSSKDMVKRDFRGWHGQRMPPGAKLEARLRLSADHIKLMDTMFIERWNDTARLAAALGWSEGRVKKVVDSLRAQGLARSGGDPRGTWYVEPTVDRGAWDGWVRYGKSPPLGEAAFDNPAYRNLDLMNIAQSLASAARQRPLNGGLISRLVDRLAAAVESCVAAAKGRSDGVRFSGLLRAALASLEDGVEPRMEAVGTGDLRRPIAKLRALVVDCRSAQVGGDSARSAHGRRPGGLRAIDRDMPDPLGVPGGGPG